MRISKLLFIFIIVFCYQFVAFGQTSFILANGNPEFLNYSGNDGVNGANGRDAESIFCLDSLVRNGLDGEDGAHGEPGFNGKDAYIYYSNLIDLKKITLIQHGGLGGQAGAGGRGSAGCNGGDYGDDGNDGVGGSDGKYGNIYLLEKGFEFESVRSSRVVSLLDIYYGNVQLGRHNWIKSLGAKALFNKNSNIKDEFFLYKSTDIFNIKMKWSNNQLITGFDNTRIALALVNGELSIRSYSGAVLDYSISKEENSFVIEVFKATDENELKSLDFGRLRYSDDKLQLEVKEKYRPEIQLKTSFIITVYKVLNSSGRGRLVGQFNVRDKLVKYINNSFFLDIGQLNFPAVYKVNGTKLRIHLSVYRESRNQTRVLSLTGLFKI